MQRAWSTGAKSEELRGRDWETWSLGDGEMRRLGEI